MLAAVCRPLGQTRGRVAGLTILQAIVLEIVQGICEFVPISRSVNLILVPWPLNCDFFLVHPELNKTFDVALHLGTFVAVVAYYWREIGHILRDFFRGLIGRRIDAVPGRSRTVSQHWGHLGTLLIRT